MARIQICVGKDAPYIEAPADLNSDTQESPGSTRIYHAGGPDAMQLFEAKSAPNLEVAVHAHKESEIVYILEGEMIVGGRTLHPGDSMFVAGMTLYSFKAGPEGLRFLNFRARQDFTYYTTAQYSEHKRLDPAGQAALAERIAEARKKEVGWD